jgi:hypothetical protein
VIVGKNSIVGPHWKKLADLMPAISTITVRDGERTCFWIDNWLPGGALCIRASALYSHAD